MTEIGQSFLNILIETPGDLVYHLVLIFTLSMTIQTVLSKKEKQASSAFKRILFALVLVFILQILFFLTVLFTWQGMASQRLIVPPLDRVISTISLIILLWAAIFTREGRTADWVSTFLCLAIIGLSVFSFTAWQSEYSQYTFNYSWLDWSWNILTAFVLIACILLVLTQKEKPRLPALIFINLNLLGYLAQLLWGYDTADYSIYTRLTQLISYPLLPGLYLSRLNIFQKENLLLKGHVDLGQLNRLLESFTKSDHFSEEINTAAKILSETLQCHTFCFSRINGKEIASLFIFNSGGTGLSQEKALDPSDVGKLLPLFAQTSVSVEITKAASDSLSIIEQTVSQKLHYRKLFSLVFSLPDESPEGILLLLDKPLRKVESEIFTLLDYFQKNINKRLMTNSEIKNIAGNEYPIPDNDGLMKSLREQLGEAEKKIDLLEKRLSEKTDPVGSTDIHDLIELEKESQKVIKNLRQENQNSQKTIQRLQDEIGLYTQNIQQLQQEIVDSNRIIQNLEKQKGVLPENNREVDSARLSADIGNIIEKNFDKISLDLLEKNINIQLDIPEELSGQISGKSELDQALQNLLLISCEQIQPNGILRFKAVKNQTLKLRDIISIEIINEKIRFNFNSEELSGIQERLNNAEIFLKSIGANFDHKKNKESIQYLIQIPLIQEFPGLKQEHGNG